MLSGAIGLQIIARRLGVELGEQQFNKFNDIDSRELTFGEIKKLSRDHALICRALKTSIDGLSAAVKKEPVLAQLNNGRYVIVLKISSDSGDAKTITVIDPKATAPKAETIDVEEFRALWNGSGLIFKKSRKLRLASGEISVGAYNNLYQYFCAGTNCVFNDCSRQGRQLRELRNLICCSVWCIDSPYLQLSFNILQICYH